MLQVAYKTIDSYPKSPCLHLQKNSFGTVHIKFYNLNVIKRWKSPTIKLSYLRERFIQFCVLDVTQLNFPLNVLEKFIAEIRNHKC